MTTAGPRRFLQLTVTMVTTLLNYTAMGPVELRGLYILMLPSRPTMASLVPS